MSDVFPNEVDMNNETQVNMFFGYSSFSRRHLALPIPPPSTFNKRLGTVTFNYLQVRYEARIADDTKIVDEKHKKTFNDALQWMQFIHKLYKEKDTEPQITAHEIFKKKRKITSFTHVLKPLL